jgi:hypothetical protein
MYGERASRKMVPMLHAPDDGLPAAAAHSDPISRAVLPAPRPVGVRRGPRPHPLAPRAGEAVAGAVRSGRSWS